MELMAKKRGLTLLDLKKRSQYSSVTTMGAPMSRRRQPFPITWLMLTTSQAISPVLYPRLTRKW